MQGEVTQAGEQGAAAEMAQVPTRAIGGNWFRTTVEAMVLFLLTGLFMSAKASAQPAPRGSGTGFEAAGQALASAFCEFTGSTIVVVVVGFGLLGLLLAFTLSEDSRFLGGVLKAAIGGSSIFFISGIIRLLGIGDLGC